MDECLFRYTAGGNKCKLLTGDAVGSFGIFLPDLGNDKGTSYLLFF